MKKLVALFLSLCLVLGCVAFASADGYTPGTYEAVANGFGGEVKVEITVDESAITDVVITGEKKPPPSAVPRFLRWLSRSRLSSPQKSTACPVPPSPAEP